MTTDIRNSFSRDCVFASPYKSRTASPFTMSGGPKKWVSSKVRGKSSTKLSGSSNVSSNDILSGSPHHSESSFANQLDLDRAPPSPPTRLPTGSSTATTANDDSDTAFIEFGSGSTLSRACAAPANLGATGTPPGNFILGSNSSIDTNEYGTPSPSTTPPKKTWEKNYKSFLRWSGKQPGGLLSHSLANKLGAHANHGGASDAIAADNAVAAASDNLSSAVASVSTSTSHHGLGHLAKFNVSKSDPSKNSPKTSSSKHKFPFAPILTSQNQPSLPDFNSSNLSAHGKMMPSLLPPPRTLSENNATAHLMKHQEQSKRRSSQVEDHESSMDLGPSLVDGFPHPTSAAPQPTHSRNHINNNISKENNSSKGSSLFKSVFRHKMSNNKLNQSSVLDDSGQHSYKTASSSSSRLRSKAKSSDALDSTMRRGVDRKNSPSTTPPGSNSSIATNSPRQSPSSVGTPVGTPGRERISTQEEVEVKAAALSRLVNRQFEQEQAQGPENQLQYRQTQPNQQYTPMPQQHQQSQTVVVQFNEGRSVGHAAKGMKSDGDLCGSDPSGMIDARDGSNDNSYNSQRNKDTLDQPRHRGHALSSDSKHLLFSRVASMGSNLTIREGHEGVIATNHHTIGSSTNPRPMHNRSTTMGIPSYLDSGQTSESYQVGIVNTEEEELIRERKKAFTDFHNMGIDSSSAYLGDDPSLHHKHSSIFLSSMAYPAGSAGGKVRTRPTHGINGPHSLDQRHVQFIESTSMSALTMTPHLNETGEVAPERALRPLEGPEHWKKAERHAIIPAVLCMCPIQVLNHIMSRDEGVARNPSNPGTINSGYGIGSIISEDDGSVGDSNGWFFGEHHHHPATGVGGALSSYQYHRAGTKSNVPSSAFGKIVLGKATVAALGMRSFLGEVYGWCTGVFVLRQNYLFEYRENDSVNGLPWGYAMLQMAEVYPHKHFTNALHLDFFERPCSKIGKRSLLIRVESKEERDRWVSLLHLAARMTIHDLYDVDESEGATEFGRGRYAVVRPAKRRVRRRGISFSETRYPHVSSHDTFRSASSTDSLSGCRSSNNDLSNAGPEYDCALKIIDKQEFWSRVRKDTERADTLVREAAVQTTLAVQGADTPGFLRLRNIFETGEQLVLELELLKGTDLFQHISSRGVLDEVEAAHIMRDLLTCLSVMDQIGIAHRDIKPANLLMCDEESEGTRVKLADYGMSSFVGVDNLVRGRCGTPGFVAPEIFLTGVNGGYGNKVDMYSAGVTLYVMLAGYEPFYGESDTELINANKEAKVDFPHAEWHLVSIEGRDLIERMLVVDPAKRIGPNEALRHPWITRRAPRNTTKM